MPSTSTTLREITKVDHRYQIKGDPQLHLSDCLLIVFPEEPLAAAGVPGVSCTCKELYTESE